MKPTTFFLVAVLAAFQLAFVAGAALDTSTASGNPYPLSLATISGTFLGEYIEINGSADALIAEIEKKYGDEFRTLAASNPNNLNISSSFGNFSAPGSLLQKRSFIWPPHCFHNGYRWKTTDWDWIKSLWENLRRMGDFNVRVGGRNCAFLGCYLDARALICNDNDYTFNVRMRDLSHFVEAIAQYPRCEYYSRLHGWQAGGQLFDTNGYNAIVRRRFSDESTC